MTKKASVARSNKASMARSNTIRDINRQIVLNYVRERGPISRAEIAHEIALQRSIVSVIVEELMVEGLIEEIRGESSGGRPPLLLSIRTAKATEHLYIRTDTEILGGEPIIRSTRTPVRAIVEMWRQGTAPEEIPKHLPHLTLAQVFDALSYYSDHTSEINAYIERNRIPNELIERLDSQ
jgi:uncharacterized protein (DUF433 family)